MASGPNLEAFSNYINRKMSEPIAEETGIYDQKYLNLLENNVQQQMCLASQIESIATKLNMELRDIEDTDIDLSGFKDCIRDLQDLSRGIYKEQIEVLLTALKKKIT